MITKEQYQKLPKSIRKQYKLDKLNQMKEFTLLHSSEFTNDMLKTICQLPLEELNISNCDITDISCIEHIITLKRLFLHNIKIVDIASIGYLNNLEELTLSKINIKDIEPLSYLSKLVLLDLYETPIKTIKPIKALTNLKRLNLYKTNVSDISILKKMKELTWLELSSSKVDDRALKATKGLPLSYLGLNDLLLNDISDILNMKSLKELDMYRTIVNEESTKVLDKLSNMRNLSLNR
jgi:Leucine-rich repeat (LRR) protein